MSLGLRSVTAQNTALVVIDYQERLLKIMDKEKSDACIRNINMAVRLFKHLRSKVFVTEQYVKGLGSTHSDIHTHLEGIPIFEKMAFSCCGEPTFMKALKAAKRKKIVLTGMETHICVLHTALDLLERGYEVYVLVDGVLSSSKLKWKYGLRAMEQAGAVVLPTESLLFGLVNRCGTDDFKFLSSMLKE